MKVLAVSVDLSRLRDVPFEPENEPWNEYRLKDGAILRFRLIVTKLLDSGKVDPLTKCPSYVVGFRTLVSVRNGERGRPTPPPPKLEEIPDDKKEIVDIVETIKEDWNVYIVNGSYRYEIKPVISTVYKLKGYFDPAGYPVYHVRSSNIERVRKMR